MKFKALMFTIFFGFLSSIVITGCSDKEESKHENIQENGHGHSHD